MLSNFCNEFPLAVERHLEWRFHLLFRLLFGETRKVHHFHPRSPLGFEAERKRGEKEAFFLLANVHVKGH